MEFDGIIEKPMEPSTLPPTGGATQSKKTQPGIEHVRVRVLPDGRMPRQDAARYLGHQPKTLAMWALQGKGPPFVKVGGKVFYFKEDLEAFVHGESLALLTKVRPGQRQRMRQESCHRIAHQHGKEAIKL